MANSRPPQSVCVCVCVCVSITCESLGKHRISSHLTHNHSLTHSMNMLGIHCANPIDIFMIFEYEIQWIIQLKIFVLLKQWCAIFDPTVAFLIFFFFNWFIRMRCDFHLKIGICNTTFVWLDGDGDGWLFLTNQWMS